MRKMLFILGVLFIFVNIKSNAVELNENSYLDSIKKDKIIMGVESDDYNKFLFYLKYNLKLNIEVKSVSNKDAMKELLSKQIDFLYKAPVNYGNENIKYINNFTINTLGIIAMKNRVYNQNEVYMKNIGIINSKPVIDNCQSIIKKNKNIRYYNTIGEMAQAIKDKKIEMGIININNIVELKQYTDVSLIHNIVKDSWKTAIATANPKYYKLVDFINTRLKSQPALVNSIFYTDADLKADIKKNFLNTLTKDELDYIKNNPKINLLAQSNSFPVLYTKGSEYDGIICNFMKTLNNLTGMKVNFIRGDNKTKLSKKNLVTEQIDYDKNDNSNLIYTTNLVVVTLSNNIKNELYIDLIRNNTATIGALNKQNLQQNKFFEKNLTYYNNSKDLINALKKGKVDFIVIDKTIFDYYSLENTGYNIVQIEQINNPVYYYLQTDNKTLNSILEKAYNVYKMESQIYKGNWNSIKDYIQKEHIKTAFENNQFYKYLTLIFGLLVSIAFVAIVYNRSIIKKEKNLIKKLNIILENNQKLDILEIDLKNKHITCTNGLLFNNKKFVRLAEYLKIINISYSDYVKEHALNKVNTIEYCTTALINGENRYFKEYVYTQNDKKNISIVMDMTEEIKQKRMLQDKLQWDDLTGLINRYYYQEKIQALIYNYPDSKGLFLFIDINDFKKFNDKYSHSFGDKVINVISGRLKKFRNLKCIPFRIAGDEFGMYTVLDEGTDINEYLEHLSETLTIDEEIDDIFVNVSCSIGASVYKDDSSNIADLQTYSEFAMYQCKQIKAKASEYKLFDRTNYEKYILDKIRKGNINKVIKDKEYYFVFQPIVDIKTKKLYGVEGLTRITNKKYKDVMDFLQVGKLVDREEELSILFAKNILEYYSKNMKFNKYKIFINSAINDNLNIDNYIIGKVSVENILKNSTLKAENIVLEVSERNSLKQVEKINQYLNLFKEIGTKVAIDDFGEGYSNQSALINLKPDLVKLDKILITGIDDDADDRIITITSNTITMLKNLGIKIIAEGVETKEELDILQNLGVDFVQGFYFQKPCNLNHVKEDFSDMF